MSLDRQLPVTQVVLRDDLTPTVSARDLHAFLESSRQFANWIDDRLRKFEFEEGEDFLTKLLKSPRGRPASEYHLTFDCAKQLAMVENNVKGKAVLDFNLS